MAKKKVFLPRWILWAMLPLFALVWGIITYSTFGTASGQEELGIVG